MRWSSLLVVLVACAVSAADRQWQTGSWADAGISRNPLVADPRGDSPAVVPNGGPKPIAEPKQPALPEVGRYVIETREMRYTVEDLVPLGGTSSVDRMVKIGEQVTFAVSKDAVYVRGDGKEYRLRLLRRDPVRR